MRVIGGYLGGRKINPPVGKWPTRPTTDYARESLFNILQHQVELQGIRVMDLFGGTGAISFEFVSRGAAYVDYVDRFSKCGLFVKSKAEEFGVKEKLNVHTKDAISFMDKVDRRYDLVFADPPYDFDKYPELYEKSMKLIDPESSAGVLIIEHSSLVDFSSYPGFERAKNYGDVHFSFFAPNQA